MTTAPSRPRWYRRTAGRCSLALLQQLGRGVVVRRRLARDPVEAATGVLGSFHQSERAVADRVQEAVVDDLLQQLDRLAQDLAGPLCDEPVRLRAEVLVKVAGGT